MKNEDIKQLADKIHTGTATDEEKLIFTQTIKNELSDLNDDLDKFIA